MSKFNIDMMRDNTDFEKLDDQLVEAVSRHVKDLDIDAIETDDLAASRLLRWVKLLVATALIYD